MKKVSQDFQFSLLQFKVFPSEIKTFTVKFNSIQIQSSVELIFKRTRTQRILLGFSSYNCTRMGWWGHDDDKGRKNVAQKKIKFNLWSSSVSRRHLLYIYIFRKIRMCVLCSFFPASFFATHIECTLNLKATREKVSCDKIIFCVKVTSTKYERTKFSILIEILAHVHSNFLPTDHQHIQKNHKSKKFRHAMREWEKLNMLMLF